MFRASMHIYFSWFATGRTLFSIVYAAAVAVLLIAITAHFPLFIDNTFSIDQAKSASRSHCSICTSLGFFLFQH